MLLDYERTWLEKFQVSHPLMMPTYVLNLIFKRMNLTLGVLRDQEGGTHRARHDNCILALLTPAMSRNAFNLVFK